MTKLIEIAKENMTDRQLATYNGTLIRIEKVNKILNEIENTIFNIDSNIDTIKSIDTSIFGEKQINQINETIKELEIYKKEKFSSFSIHINRLRKLKARLYDLLNEL